MKTKIFLIVVGLLFMGVAAFQIFFNTVNTLNRSKQPGEWVESSLSVKANDFFWEQFHLGNYDSIPAVLEQLTAAYLDNPNDLQTVYHLGFTHFWAISERQNFETIPATIIEHAVLAQKYLGEAYRMNPQDTRLLSFLSAAKIIVGSISEDNKLITDGYLNGLKSIRDWEDFGAFSLAYTLSVVPHTDPNFQKSLQWMESTTERCYCENFDPAPEHCQQAIARLVENPENLDRSRIIPNSWVAPHNIEGFFMSYGDLIVKSGDWQKGVDIYRLAKYAPDYENWEYKEVLENRIKNAQQNVEVFRKEIPNGEKVAIDQAMMVQTSISCRACHQMSPPDLAKYQHFDRSHHLSPTFYFLE